MSQHTRYQAVSSEPPSYEDVVGEDADNHRVYREDKFISEAPGEVKMIFIRKVYAILSVQLFATAMMSVLAMFCKPYQRWMMLNPWSMWLSFVAAIAFMFLSMYKSKNWPWNVVYLSGFTVAMGYSASYATAVSDTSTVVLALFMTLSVFFGLTLFTLQSRVNFDSWAPYLSGGLWLLIITGIIAAFFPYSSTRELLFGLAGTVIFSGYIIVDTHRIMNRMHLDQEIEAAMTLYLDVLNLFLSILRILNSQSSRD